MTSCMGVLMLHITFSKYDCIIVHKAYYVFTCTCVSINSFHSHSHSHSYLIIYMLMLNKTSESESESESESNLREIYDNNPTDEIKDHYKNHRSKLTALLQITERKYHEN